MIDGFFLFVLKHRREGIKSWLGKISLSKLKESIPSAMQIFKGHFI